MDMAMSILLQSLNVKRGSAAAGSVRKVSPQLRKPTVSFGWSKSSVSWRTKHGKADRQESVHQVRRWEKVPEVT